MVGEVVMGSDGAMGQFSDGMLVRWVALREVMGHEWSAGKVVMGSYRGDGAVTLGDGLGVCGGWEWLEWEWSGSDRGLVKHWHGERGFQNTGRCKEGPRDITETETTAMMTDWWRMRITWVRMNTVWQGPCKTVAVREELNTGRCNELRHLHIETTAVMRKYEVEDENDLSEKAGSVTRQTGTQ